jgi:CheY-like chemotaxis protein
VSATREEDEIVLRVRDNGIGIDSVLLSHVFEMFTQGARGPDRAEGGLGLGLALVRTLTNLHGGTVSAHSDGPGKGSEFTVRLPASEPSIQVGPDAASTRRTRAGARSRRVLIVDDNHDGAEMMSHLLSTDGHDVRIANDPSQALRLVEEFLPQVAILDIGLPVMDGYALARELRARLGSATPVLIALSGYGSDRDRRQSDEAGFLLHLVKPVDAEALARALEAVERG